MEYTQQNRLGTGNARFQQWEARSKYSNPKQGQNPEIQAESKNTI